VTPLLEFFAASGPIVQAFVATMGTYLLTAIGTLPVLFFRSAPRHLMDAMMGFAGGVMVAASCWSLLVPAIETGGVLTAAVGVLGGGAFLFIADQSLPHLHAEFPDEASTEGPKVAWQKSALLMFAMTLHNFPEGMAVGVRFGGGDLGAAVALAIGIGLWLAMEKTRLGAQVRATVDDAEMARGVGIDTSRISMLIFALGAFLAGLGGVIGGAFLGVYPGLDFEILPLAFAVVIIGGMGSLGGAAIGALLVGLADNFGKALFPEISYFTLYAPMALILAVKPTGLFGRE